MSENFIDGEVARWAAPSNIKALTTFRSGGVSGDVFDSLNLATHVGDDPAAVIENRIRSFILEKSNEKLRNFEKN